MLKMSIRRSLGMGFCALALAVSLTAAETPDSAGMTVATTPCSGFAGPHETRTFWKPRYEKKLAQAVRDGEKIPIVLVGDSITHFWEEAGAAVYKQYFGAYDVLNLGFSGDRTQHLLWLVEQGRIFERIHPKLIVMMIGTNNLGWKESGPEATAAGIARAVNSLRRVAPDAKIVLFAVFPRGRTAADPFRAQISETNRLIAPLADGKNVFFEDINAQLLSPDGSISSAVMADYLHPTARGYEIWARAIMPYVRRYVDGK